MCMIRNNGVYYYCNIASPFIFDDNAIKYIDGTEIKDVKIGGEKTVKAGVKYDNEPTARILNTQIKDTSVTIDFELNDQEDLIKDNEIVFYLADGEEIVEIRAPSSATVAS